MTRVQRIGLAGLLMIVAGSVPAAAASATASDAVWAALATVLLGVGASLVASAGVIRIIASQLGSVDFEATVEGLRAASRIARTNQHIEITCRLNDTGLVQVSSEHRFELRPPRLKSRTFEFEMYTDIGRFGAPSDAGFHSVVEPDGSVLELGDLTPFISVENGKQRFRKAYQVGSGPLQFTFTTTGSFRKRDNLVWTLEGISDGLKLRINDEMNASGKLGVKINHHQEERIEAAARAQSLPSGGSRTDYDFGESVLPFQGFELIWDIEDRPPTRTSA